MKLNTLVKTNVKKIRPGRGIGSGKGKTGGRGVKGQKSRSGVAIKAFEGGQTPLYRRLPKRGFKSLFPNNTAIINLFHLQKFHDNKKIDLGTPVDLKLLQQKKIINKKYLKLKILGDGDLKSKINITVNFASKQAQEKIKKAGGTLNLLKKYQAQAKIKKDSENPSVLKK
jgi:large subunit ribosomal protein L15|tara:strand:+ start:1444 stop:1953 length:510 start_codon:yes stop_codon:yes gene_type:complete